MVEPTGSQIQANSLKQNARTRVDSEKKSDGRTSSESVGANQGSPSDKIELSSSQTENANLRPPKQPIEDDQAGEIINFTSRLITDDHNEARFAQGNLNPDRVLELIA